MIKETYDSLVEYVNKNDTDFTDDLLNMGCARRMVIGSLNFKKGYVMDEVKHVEEHIAREYDIITVNGCTPYKDNIKETIISKGEK